MTALALLLAVLTLGVVTLDSDIGHRFVVNRIGALRPANGLRYSIGRIDGSLFGRARLVDFRLRDPKGLVLYVPRAELNWTPFAWLHNRLDITSLVIPQARLFKLPQPTPTGRTGPILPGFDIHIGTLRVDRLSVAPRDHPVRRGAAVCSAMRTFAAAARWSISMRWWRAATRCDLNSTRNPTATDSAWPSTRAAPPAEYSPRRSVSRNRSRRTCMGPVAGARGADARLPMSVRTGWPT